LSYDDVSYFSFNRNATSRNCWCVEDGAVRRTVESFVSGEMVCSPALWEAEYALLAGAGSPEPLLDVCANMDYKFLHMTPGQDSKAFLAIVVVYLVTHKHTHTHIHARMYIHK
jgi:hypothetical protein